MQESWIKLVTNGLWRDKEEEDTGEACLWLGEHRALLWEEKDSSKGRCSCVHEYMSVFVCMCAHTQMCACMYVCAYVCAGRLEVNLRHVELEESMEQPIKVAPSSSWDNFPKATKIYIIANLSQENGKYLSKGVSLLQKKLELPQESQCVKGRLRMRYSHWRLRK